MKPSPQQIRGNATIQENTVKVNLTELLSVPAVNDGRADIQVLGTEHGDVLNRILIGTGTRGDGLILDYITHDAQRSYDLQQIYNPGINAMDILPVRSDDTAHQANDVLIAGEGYAQSGVRHVSLYNPRQADIMPTEAFNAYKETLKRQYDDMFTPRLSVDEDTEQIYLAMHPTTATEIADEPRARKDITDKLHHNGINIENTLERVTNYDRTYTH